MIELLIVVVIVGMLAVLAVPRMRTMREQSNLSAARARVEAMVATARSIAVHKGREGLFFASGNWIGVWTRDPQTGFWTNEMQYQHLPSAYGGVHLQLGGSGYSWVWFDARGLTRYKPPSTTVFRLVGPTRADSVCVTRLGQTLPRACDV